MSKLPIIQSKPVDCFGCGVCCLHMGYPAFVKPKPPLTLAEIESDPRLRRLAEDPRTKASLLKGHDGEPHWHSLPDHLREELDEFVASYAAPEDGQLDGACFWLDPETRLCKHHEYRPNVCRDFEIGCQQCLDWRSHYSEVVE